MTSKQAIETELRELHRQFNLAVYREINVDEKQLSKEELERLPLEEIGPLIRTNNRNNLVDDEVYDAVLELRQIRKKKGLKAAKEFKAFPQRQEHPEPLQALRD